MPPWAPSVWLEGCGAFLRNLSFTLQERTTLKERPLHRPLLSCGGGRPEWVEMQWEGYENCNIAAWSPFSTRANPGTFCSSCLGVWGEQLSYLGHCLFALRSLTAPVLLTAP